MCRFYNNTLKSSIVYPNDVCYTCPLKLKWFDLFSVPFLICISRHVISSITNHLKWSISRFFISKRSLLFFTDSHPFPLGWRWPQNFPSGWPPSNEKHYELFENQIRIYKLFSRFLRFWRCLENKVEVRAFFFFFIYLFFFCGMYWMRSGNHDRKCFCSGERMISFHFNWSHF